MPLPMAPLIAGVNYTATSGTLTFVPGQTFETFIVPISDDPQITGNLIFFVNLSKTNGVPGSISQSGHGHGHDSG